MTIETDLRNRIEELIREGGVLSLGNEHGQCTGSQLQRCAGWITAAQNAVYHACPEPSAPYRQKADQIATTNYGYVVHNAVGELSEVLKNLLVDAEAGLLASVADRARAETFDDFLDHAETYAKANRKEQSGVLAGVVFEDTLRRRCRKLKIQEKGEKLDAIISNLASHGEFSAVKAKRARAAADVRTKATHAQWNEFTISDVKSTIEFARELIADKLDT